MVSAVQFKIVGKTIRFAGRDIIKVQLENGIIQPMYRSSGRNSGMPGVWLPFTGIAIIPYLWFDKEEFCHKSLAEKGLDRFGTSELKEISRILTELNLPPAKFEIKSPRRVNFYLHTAKALKHNQNWKDLQKFLKG